MKKLIMTALTLVLCANASGQKLDAMSQITLRQMEQNDSMQVSSAKAYATSQLKNNQSRNLKAIVKLAKETDITELASYGYTAKQLSSDFAIVSTSLDSLAMLSDINFIERISIEQNKMELQLDKANALTGVDKIYATSDTGFNDDKMQDTNGLTKAYTGKNVMIGILDSGFDPNHPMFLDKDGKSRFKLIKTPNGKLLSTPEEIASFTTDNAYNSHATHVAGIAAGNYEGIDFKLHGVATEADLAMGPMSLEVSNLEYLKYLAEYCKEHNQRLVVNMSFGQNVGPHDGSDLYTQALNEIIKEYDIIACMSAGNQAHLQIVQKKTLTEEDKEMKCIYNTTASLNCIDQYITTNQPTPIDMDIVLVKIRTGEIEHSYPLIVRGEAQEVIADDEFMSAHIYIGSEDIHDGLKGYSIKSEDAKMVKSGCRIGYVLRGECGQVLASYSSTVCPYYLKTKGWDENVTSNGSILNEACGTETIIVGAYISNENVSFVNSSTKNIYSSYKTQYGCTGNQILASSSFATNFNGEYLPHICAPGAYIESAANRYEEANTSLTRTIKENSETVPFCSKMGTSMSSPYMAGVAALWLEANPTLTHQQIKEIAMNTAIDDEDCNSNNHYVNEGKQAGAGKIDAYAGLKFILDENETTLINTPSEKSFLIHKKSSSLYEAYQTGATYITFTLYNIEGKVIKSESSKNNSIDISTKDITRGVYVLRVISNKGVFTRKIAI